MFWGMRAAVTDRSKSISQWIIILAAPYRNCPHKRCLFMLLLSSFLCTLAYECKNIFLLVYRVLEELTPRGTRTRSFILEANMSGNLEVVTEKMEDELTDNSVKPKRQRNRLVMNTAQSFRANTSCSQLVWSEYHWRHVGKNFPNLQITIIGFEW